MRERKRKILAGSVFVREGYKEFKKHKKREEKGKK